MHHGVYVAGIKGRACGEQVVERGAQRVNVVGGMRQRALHLLGAHVNGGATGIPFHGLLGIVIRNAGGDAKVRELQIAFAGDHHVGGLQVAMDDLLLVGITEGFAELASQSLKAAPGKVAIGLLLAQGVEVAAIDKFHGDKGQLVGRGNEVVNADDIRVRKLVRLLHFTGEILERLRISH